MFTRNERQDHDGADHTLGRDVFNERPQDDDIRVVRGSGVKEELRAKSAVLHTTKGDIHITLFGDKCPKTVENFTVHSNNNYYNGVIFHRVIKPFMIQTGDPLGDGTGLCLITRIFTHCYKQEVPVFGTDHSKMNFILH